jgi:hypothetical protein
VTLQNDVVALLRWLEHSAILTPDAKSDVRYMLALQESGDYDLGNRFTDGLLYPFLANSTSPAGEVLRSHLRGYSGDLLDAILELPKSEGISPHFNRQVFSLAAEYLERPLTSGDFLNALLVYAPAEANRPFFSALRDRRVVTSEHHPVAESTLERFLRARKLDVHELAMALHGYLSMADPHRISERFSLAIRLLDNGLLRAEVVERWGGHSVLDAKSEVVSAHGLWLPESVVFLPQEMDDFERLLNALPTAPEEAYQEFFEAHPKWLYLLGEQYDSFESQVRLPAVNLHHELALIDGAVESSELKPDFLLKRIDLELWDVLDIKRSDFKTVVGRKARRKLSDAVTETVAQLREYKRRLQQGDVRLRLRQQYGITVAEPIAMAVIGRDTDFKNLREKSLFTVSDGVKIYTYDDLHRVAKHRMLRVK